MLTEPQSSFFHESLNKVRNIVLNHVPSDFSVFLFGSSVTGLHSLSSDIDVGFLGPAPLSQNILRCIREDVEESFVPYRVDLVDFFTKPGTFKTIALDAIQLWQSPQKKS